MNELLASIGQSPVNSLAGIGSIGDAALARSFLNTRARATQLQGWAFNTDEDYVLNPDAEGRMRVPDGFLKITPSRGSTYLKARRHPDGSWAIWDGSAQSWTHAGAASFTIVWGFHFDDLPEVARHYVTVVAGRDFQRKLLGSNQLDGYNSQDERVAWVQLLREERANRKTNQFQKNASLAAATARRRY